MCEMRRGEREKEGVSNEEWREGERRGGGKGREGGGGGNTLANRIISTFSVVTQPKSSIISLQTSSRTVNI